MPSIASINLGRLLASMSEVNTLGSADLPLQVRTEIESILDSGKDCLIDLGDMRSLSPSFAYEVFGKLFDKYGDSILRRINFQNDRRDLSSRIVDAIKRRKQNIKIS